MNAPILGTEEAAAYIHMAPETLRYWRHRGDRGPKYFRLGAHKVFYRQEDLDTYLDEQYRAMNPAS